MPWPCLTKRTFKRSFLPVHVERNDKMNGNFRLRRCHRSCGIFPVVGSKSFWTLERSCRTRRAGPRASSKRHQKSSAAPASNLATVSLTLFRRIRRGFGTECMPGTLQPISSPVPFANRLRCFPFLRARERFWAMWIRRTSTYLKSWRPDVALHRGSERSRCRAGAAELSSAHCCVPSGLRPIMFSYCGDRVCSRRAAGITSLLVNSRLILLENGTGCGRSFISPSLSLLFFLSLCDAYIFNLRPLSYRYYTLAVIF